MKLELHANQANLKGSKTTIKTVWEIRTYDVWGNAKDGYDVNDSFRRGEITIPVEVKINNVGTPHQFTSASLTDRQIKRVFNVRCHIETDGDDLHIYVNRKRDGYPLGELCCVSHDSLSPIRMKPTQP